MGKRDKRIGAELRIDSADLDEFMAWIVRNCIAADAIAEGKADNLLLELVEWKEKFYTAYEKKLSLSAEDKAALVDAYVDIGLSIQKAREKVRARLVEEGGNPTKKAIEVAHQRFGKHKLSRGGSRS